MVELAGTGLDWSDLDTDGSGFLDGADEWVRVPDGLVLDVGGAAGGDAGEDVLTLAGAGSMSEADFAFM